VSRFPRWPLAWSSGFAVGAAAAAALGEYVPTWGAALAFPSVAVLFALGSWRESASPDGGEEITHLLRFTSGGALGFLAVNVPIALLRLSESLRGIPPEELSRALEHTTQLRMQLLARWAVIGLAVPIGATALVVRRDRAERASRVP
jgi:hypothetical protein